MWHLFIFYLGIILPSSSVSHAKTKRLWEWLPHPFFFPSLHKQTINGQQPDLLCKSKLTNPISVPKRDLKWCNRSALVAESRPKWWRAWPIRGTASTVCQNITHTHTYTQKISPSCSCSKMDQYLPGGSRWVLEACRRRCAAAACLPPGRPWAWVGLSGTCECCGKPWPFWPAPPQSAAPVQPGIREWTAASHQDPLVTAWLPSFHPDSPVLGFTHSCRRARTEWGAEDAVNVKTFICKC